jgi:hypothetical protein
MAGISMQEALKDFLFAVLSGIAFAVNWRTGKTHLFPWTALDREGD